MPTYILAEDVAKILNVPTNNIRRLARTNKIPAIRIGNLWRFDEAKVLKYIDRKYSNKYSD